MSLKRNIPRRGFSLIEATIATVIVSLLVVAALSAAGASAMAQQKLSDRAKARLLAEAMVTEILRLAYQDPQMHMGVLGPEAGETTKAQFDDVDDFEGWKESPPQNAQGAALSGWSGWSRSVKVEWVRSNELNTVSSSETGVKRITVTVQKNNATVATHVGYKMKVQ